MRMILFYLLTGFAASCGQQGPLYLPDDDQPADSQLRAAHRALLGQ
ncbi:MAG: hypothetical protein AAGG11_10275 [Pseudomonadota bacterium]